MEVKNPQAALLSNYEVLTLLRELEADNLVRTKAAIRVKKEEDVALANGSPGSLTLGGNPQLEASENLRTIEVEAIKYLSADYLPTSRQSGDGIATLTKNLAPYGLTKAEKLQIVNLAPTKPVELYVIVEELEDRLSTRMDEILEHVENSLPTNPSTTKKNSASTNRTNGVSGHAVDTSNVMIMEDHNVWDDDVDAVYEEDIYDDEGAGAGVEGDLEIDDT